MKRLALPSFTLSRFALIIAAAAVVVATSLPAEARFTGGRNIGFSPLRTYHNTAQSAYALTGDAFTTRSQSRYAKNHRNNHRYQGGR